MRVTGACVCCELPACPSSRRSSRAYGDRLMVATPQAWRPAHERGRSRLVDELAPSAARSPHHSQRRQAQRVQEEVLHHHLQGGRGGGAAALGRKPAQGYRRTAEAQRRSAGGSPNKPAPLHARPVPPALPLPPARAQCPAAAVEGWQGRWGRRGAAGDGRRRQPRFPAGWPRPPQ